MAGRDYGQNMADRYHDQHREQDLGTPVEWREGKHKYRLPDLEKLMRSEKEFKLASDALEELIFRMGRVSFETLHAPFNSLEQFVGPT